MKHLHHYLKIYCSNSSPNIGLFSGSVPTCKLHNHFARQSSQQQQQPGRTTEMMEEQQGMGWGGFCLTLPHTGTGGWVLFFSRWRRRRDGPTIASVQEWVSEKCCRFRVILLFASLPLPYWIQIMILLQKRNPLPAPTSFSHHISRFVRKRQPYIN